MEYNCMLVFHKVTSLASYFLANKHKLVGHLSSADSNYETRYNRIAERYTKMQDVRLILLCRHDYDVATKRMRTFCKIKCPVSPLPVVGEFEVPSIQAIKMFLLCDGWKETELITADLTK